MSTGSHCPAPCDGARTVPSGSSTCLLWNAFMSRWIVVNVIGDPSMLVSTNIWAPNLSSKNAALEPMPGPIPIRAGAPSVYRVKYTGSRLLKLHLRARISAWQLVDASNATPIETASHILSLQYRILMSIFESLQLSWAAQRGAWASSCQRSTGVHAVRVATSVRGRRPRASGLSKNPCHTIGRGNRILGSGNRIQNARLRICPRPR